MSKMKVRRGRRAEMSAVLLFFSAPPMYLLTHAAACGAASGVPIYRHDLSAERVVVFVYHIKLNIISNDCSGNGMRQCSIWFAIDIAIEISGSVSVRDDAHNQPRPPSLQITRDFTMTDLRLTLVLICSGEVSSLNRLYSLSSPLFCLFMLWCSKAIPTKPGQPCTGQQRMSAITFAECPCCLHCPHISTRTLTGS
jgi:hypothetical protein